MKWKRLLLRLFCPGRFRRMELERKRQTRRRRVARYYGRFKWRRKPSAPFLNYSLLKHEERQAQKNVDI